MLEENADLRSKLSVAEQKISQFESANTSLEAAKTTLETTNVNLKTANATLEKEKSEAMESWFLQHSMRKRTSP